MKAAAKVAEHIGSIHHGFVFTLQEAEDALEDVIYHLETYDITTIRASTPMFLLSRRIKAMGIKMVLSGEGSDEVLGGYLYFHQAPNDEAHQLEVIQMIRKYQPEIVLCNAIEDRHIDHAKGSQLVSDACFLSGLMKIETQLDGQSQQAWRPKVVYHYIQWKDSKPDFVVDITGFTDKKVDSILAYRSQFYDPNSNEPESPITSKNFLESLHYRTRDLGRLVGVEHAEGFTVERYLAVNTLGDLI
jgi:bacillithiol biosynthesis deacetylase BshB1